MLKKIRTDSLWTNPLKAIKGFPHLRNQHLGKRDVRKPKTQNMCQI